MRATLFDTRQHERGFSYIALMFVIVLIGLGMTVAARQWKTMVQRELEADLLSKGIEIQNALALYSAAMKAGRVVPICSRTGAKGSSMSPPGSKGSDTTAPGDDAAPEELFAAKIMLELLEPEIPLEPKSNRCDQHH